MKDTLVIKLLILVSGFIMVQFATPKVCLEVAGGLLAVELLFIAFKKFA